MSQHEGDKPDNKVHALQTGKPDAQLAEEFKARISPKLLEICLIMDEASAAGLSMEFGLAKDYAGKNVINRLIAVKTF